MSLSVINPYDQSVYYTLAFDTPAEMEAKVQGAKAAAENWREVSLAEHDVGMIGREVPGKRGLVRRFFVAFGALGHLGRQRGRQHRQGLLRAGGADPYRGRGSRRGRRGRPAGDRACQDPRPSRAAITSWACGSRSTLPIT